MKKNSPEYASEINLNELFQVIWKRKAAIILIALFFAVIGSQFIIENIFQITWKFDLAIFLQVTIGIGLATLILIMITNFKYLSPKVYPLIRNQ